MLKISSERLGKLGDYFDQAAAEQEGINVAALIAGGFLALTSTKETKKPAKTDQENPEE